MTHIETDDHYSPYCDACGGCGYVECDGIEHFLNVHVRGKTGCKNEEQFLSDIILFCRRDDDEE